MKEFVEGCRTCDPRADPECATELLNAAFQLGTAILKKREIANYRKDKTEQLLERSEQILSALVELAEIKISPPKKTAKKSSPSKSARKKYGEYKHVLLTNEEYERLIYDYGEVTVKRYITAVDEYVQQHGKTYKDYNLAIRRFIRTDNSEPVEDTTGHSYNLELYWQNAIENTPKIKKEV